MDFFRCYIMSVSCKQRRYGHSQEAILWAEIAQKCMAGWGSALDPAVGAYRPPSSINGPYF